jgi:hypothetical protein
LAAWLAFKPVDRRPSTVDMPGALSVAIRETILAMVH